MKKLLGILVLGLLWCGNVYAGSVKGVGVCGLQSQLTDMSDAGMSIKIDKTGIKNDSNEGVIAPLVFTILSAILCYGLADKIYM